MPAHVKSSLMGVSLTIPITNGRLNLGTWQGIWLCEHRNRAGKCCLSLLSSLRPILSITPHAPISWKRVPHDNRTWDGAPLARQSRCSVSHGMCCCAVALSIVMTCLEWRAS
eukprot:Opistho-2@70507